MLSSLLQVWTSSSTALAESKVTQIINATRDFAFVYDSICLSGRDISDTVQKINDAFNRLITLTMADTTLHIIAVVPLYEESAEEQINKLCEACAAVEHNLSLHILGLCGGIRRIFQGHATGSDVNRIRVRTVARLKELSKEVAYSLSYSLIDDYAANGASIGFTINSLSRYIALLQMALMENYYSILSPALVSANRGENLSLGLASLSFEREAMIGRLLELSFLAALDDVGINNKEVDLQKAVSEAETVLAGIESRYPDLYKHDIRSLYADQVMVETDVLPEASTLIDNDIAALKTRILDLLGNGSFSLPAKEAILAMILGRDNDNLRGMQYKHEGMLLDDGCSQPINLYVDAFNRWCKDTHLLPVRGDFEPLKKLRWNSLTNKFEDSPENGDALNPLAEIKRLKQEILNAASFIREKNDELTALQKALVLRRDTEEIRHHWHRPKGEFKNIEYKEKSLDDKYIPGEGVTIKDTVDLRKYFAPVRNQSSLGSCTSFAVTAMYEAMMNRNGAEGENIMSPAFLFYHSNILTGRPEGGSNYREQLEILAEEGICYEDMYGYDAESSFPQPSENVVEEAKNHRVITAKQLPLVNEINKPDTLRHNHKLITSALSEGYPVGISLKVYDNLGQTGAFISHPEDTPEAKEDGWHAMVIVGYSEANSFYIVRNSWGKEFGENGYCYIATAYIDDPRYMDFACIITEITDTKEGMSGDIPDFLADFAATETEIRIAAIRNAIAKVRIDLENNQNLYAEYYKYYQRLLLQLTIPKVQQTISGRAEAAQAHSHEESGALMTRGDESVEKESPENKKKYGQYAIGSLFTVVGGCGIAAWFAMGSVLGIIAAGSGSLGLVALGGYKWWRSKKRKDTQNGVEESAIDVYRKAAALSDIKMQYHVAGMWISRFHKLSIEIGRVYDRLVSYNNTLREWQHSYFSDVSRPVVMEGQMFRSLESAALSDEFFEENKDKIVGRIDLLKVFEGYKGHNEDLNITLDNLRKSVRSAIDSMIGDFNIADYLLGDSYPYLMPVDVPGELAALIAVGQPSYRNPVMHATPPVRIVMVNLDRNKAALWESSVISCFPLKPIQLPLIDPSMLLVITIHPLTDRY